MYKSSYESGPYHPISLPEYNVPLTAKALRDNADGKRTWLHDLGPGGTFGELAMLDNAPLRASCICNEPVDFVVLSRDAFRDVLLTLPRLGNKLLMLFLRAASQRRFGSPSA